MPVSGDRRKEFVGPKGATFAVGSDNTGLYHVEMLNGGIRPKVCDQRFTRIKDTELAIKTYIKTQTGNPKTNNKVAASDASRKSE
jgi:hypothetical protein